MHASAVSCRRTTLAMIWTLPWAPFDASGPSWVLSSLQVLSRVRGLNRRAIAFSGRIPYFGGRFLTIEESSHAGSHGHGGTAAGRGRHPRGPAPLPVRDGRVRKLHAVRPRPPARQPDRRRRPARLLDHQLARDRGGRIVHAAPPDGWRSGDGLPGVVRFREHRAQLRLREKLLHPGRLLRHGLQQQRGRGLPGRRRARGDRRPDLHFRPRGVAPGGTRVLRAQDSGSRHQQLGRPAGWVSGVVVFPRPQPSRSPVSRGPQGKTRLDPRRGRQGPPSAAAGRAPGRFAGGGFAIMEALNVQVSCATCTGSDLGQLQDEADRAATKAFFWWMGGVDIKQGRLALYGQYILTSAAANFLIQGTTHTFQGGVRYSLGSSKEGITDRQ